MGNCSIQETARQADDLYSMRQRIENVRASVTILENAVAIQEGYEIQWRLGRALFFLGQEAPDKKIARSYHSRGIAFCEQAVAAAHDRVDGHFWLGVNLALQAQCERWLVAIRHAMRARRELERAIQIDSSYHAAAPLRVLARLQHKLPPWLGGGLGRARVTYEMAATLAPKNTVTRIYFAELLLELGEQDHAQTQLEFVLGVPDDPEWAFEIARDRLNAKQMLARLSPPV